MYSDIYIICFGKIKNNYIIISSITNTDTNKKNQDYKTIQFFFNNKHESQNSQLTICISENILTRFM